MSSRFFSLSMLIPGLLGCLMLAGCQHHHSSRSSCNSCHPAGAPSYGEPVYTAPTYQEASPAYSEPAGSGTRMPFGSGTR